jgi:hypothetical protein
VTPSKPLTALALAGAIALGLLATACGGSARNGVAQIGSTQTTTTSSNSSGSPSDRRGALVAFSACMHRRKPEAVTSTALLRHAGPNELLRPPRRAVGVTVLQPPISYNGLRRADQ